MDLGHKGIDAMAKAWLCPYGCGSHMVDFTRIAKNVRLADRRGLL